MAVQRSRAAGLLACVVAAVALAVRGAPASRMLVLVTAYWQVGGAALIALLWWQRRAARVLVFLLLCLAVWAGWDGIVSSLAFSVALAFYIDFLNHIATPLTRLRRWVGTAAFTLDGAAALCLMLPVPATLSHATLVVLDVVVVICSGLAITSARDQRSLALWTLLPVVCFATVVTLEDIAALMAIAWVSAESFEKIQCAIAFTLPVCFAAGLRNQAATLQERAAAGESTR